MRFSTRGRYGVRMMLDLALNHGKGHTLMREIAERQEISEKYLEQLVIPLKRAGLVKSIRGAHGGYALARHPYEIKMSEIVQTLEGPLALVKCVNDADLCHRVPHCVVRDFWTKIKRAVENVLKTTTLQDLVERQEVKTADSEDDVRNLTEGSDGEG